jgi:predicted DNA-binding transcriptional regulator AlpA
MANDREHLSTKEAAAIIGVSEWWLYQRRSEIGTGPDFFRVGRNILYRKNDVERWMESRRNQIRMTA